MLKDFENVSDHFGTLCIERVKIKLTPYRLIRCSDIYKNYFASFRIDSTNQKT